MQSKRMWKIEMVTDTRSWEPGYGYIPGSGDPRSCDDCGKTHEIHVQIRNRETGKVMVVGSTCAKKMVYDWSALTTKALKSAQIAKYYNLQNTSLRRGGAIGSL